MGRTVCHVPSIASGVHTSVLLVYVSWSRSDSLHERVVHIGSSNYDGLEREGMGGGGGALMPLPAPLRPD